MDHEIDVVHQHPLALPASLDRIRIGSELPLQAELDLIGDRHHLPAIGAARDQEKIGEPRIHGIQLQDAGFLGLLVGRGRRGRQYHLARLCRCHQVSLTLLKSSPIVAWSSQPRQYGAPNDKAPSP